MSKKINDRAYLSKIQDYQIKNATDVEYVHLSFMGFISGQLTSIAESLAKIANPIEETKIINSKELPDVCIQCEHRVPKPRYMGNEFVTAEQTECSCELKPNDDGSCPMKDEDMESSGLPRCTNCNTYGEPLKLWFIPKVFCSKKCVLEFAEKLIKADKNKVIGIDCT